MVGKLRWVYFLAQVALTSCIDGFEFNTEGDSVAIVVESEISNVSASDYFDKFSEYRYFETKLNWASRVKNVRDEPIEGAEVELYADTNEYWDYTEVSPGAYQLLYKDFKALPNIGYRLLIRLPDGTEIESALEITPESRDAGVISFEEASKLVYEIELGEERISEIDGVEVSTNIPILETEDFGYYRWDFLTTWVLRAPLIGESNPVGVCWVTENYYIDNFELLKSKKGGEKKALFFVETNRNLNIENGFSVRVKQTNLSKNYFQFWEDLYNQKKQEDLFAPPPYNTYSNLRVQNSDMAVVGYFGVAAEVNHVWYLKVSELSYTPIFSAPCYLEFANDRPAYCNNCLNYESVKFGDKVTNLRPDWWSQ